MNGDLRSSLTVTADASQVVVENRRAAESVRELGKEAEATAQRMVRAAAEQATAVDRLARSRTTPQQNDHVRAWEQEAAAQARAYRALEESLNPLIRAEREFAAAQEVVNQALQSGQVTQAQADRSLAELERRFEGLTQAQQVGPTGAEFKRAIEADERSVRQLMASLDPAAQVLRQFEQAQQLVTRSLRSGIITQDEATRSMALLEAQQLAMGRSGFSAGQQVQNASFQLTDAIVQIQGGVAPTVAIAQQLPQLLGGFGALGAVLGLVVAVGAPLAGMWLQNGDAAGDLDDRLQALETSLGDVSEHLKILRDTRLDETFGTMTGSVRSLTEELLKLDRAAELKNLENALDTLLKQKIEPGFGQVLGTTLENMMSLSFGSGSARRPDPDQMKRENYADLTSGRGPSFEDFQTQRSEITALAKAGEVEKVAERVSAMISSFTQGGPVTDLNADLANTLVEMGKWARQTAEVEARYNGSADAARKLREEEEKTAAARKDGDERIRVAQNELALKQAIAQYGADSREAEAENARIARENYQVDLDRAGIMGDQRDRLLEIHDANQGVSDATAAWADRMAGVREELRGVFDLIQNMAGGVVDRAAQAAELKALQAGDKVSAAAAKGQAARREAEAAARAQQLGGGLFGRAVAGVQQWWDEGGDRIGQDLAAAREGARDREREASRSTRGRSSSGSRGLGAISNVKEELARLRPSYDADVAAAEAWRAKALASLDKTRAGYDGFAKDVQSIFDEKIAKAYEADLERREDWAAGVERGQLRISEEVKSWADISEDMFTEFSRAGEDAFLQLSRTGKLEMGDLVDFVLEQATRMTYQQAIAPGMNAMFGGLTNMIGSAIGGFFGGTGAATTASVPTNHTGSPGVMRTYQIGGGYGDTMRQDERLTMVRDGEQIMTSRAMENAGALISTMAQAISSQSQPIAVDSRPIINPVNRTSVPDMQFEVEESTDARGQRQYDLVMSDAVSAGLTARGGKAQKTLRNQYGLHRPGVRRP